MELNLLSGLLLLALLCLAMLPFAIPGVLEVLLALAIGAFVTAALIWFGWLPQDTSLVLLSLAMLTALSALLLWKPLRKLQKTKDNGHLLWVCDQRIHINTPLVIVQQRNNKRLLTVWRDHSPYDISRFVAEKQRF